MVARTIIPVRAGIGAAETRTVCVPAPLTSHGPGNPHGSVAHWTTPDVSGSASVAPAPAMSISQPEATTLHRKAEPGGSASSPTVVAKGAAADVSAGEMVPGIW